MFHRKAMICAVLMATVAVSGCARTHLVRAGATPAEVNKDNNECQFEAVRAVPMSSGDVVEVAFSRHEIQRSCLFAKGYQELPL